MSQFLVLSKHLIAWIRYSYRSFINVWIHIVKFIMLSVADHYWLYTSTMYRLFTGYQFRRKCVNYCTRIEALVATSIGCVVIYEQVFADWLHKFSLAIFWNQYFMYCPNHPVLPLTSSGSVLVYPWGNAYCNFRQIYMYTFGARVFSADC